MKWQRSLNYYFFDDAPLCSSRTSPSYRASPTACLCWTSSSVHCSSVMAQACSTLSHDNWTALKTTCQTQVKLYHIALWIHQQRKLYRWINDNSLCMSSYESITFVCLCLHTVWDLFCVSRSSQFSYLHPQMQMCFGACSWIWFSNHPVSFKSFKFTLKCVLLIAHDKCAVCIKAA